MRVLNRHKLSEYSDYLWRLKRERIYYYKRDKNATQRKLELVTWGTSDGESPSSEGTPHHPTPHLACGGVFVGVQPFIYKLETLGNLPHTLHERVKRYASNN